MAYARGVRFVYASNIAEMPELAHTRCPSCFAEIIVRFNYETVSNHLEGGACHRCGAVVPGLFA